MAGGEQGDEFFGELDPDPITGFGHDSTKLPSTPDMEFDPVPDPFEDGERSGGGNPNVRYARGAGDTGQT
ncbi:MAG: hypothetical protein OEY28_09025, partial [Nitrospira sp.]|nr:hypothetical protein [Nitrospira sp.]